MNFLATLNNFFFVNETAVVVTAIVALILFQLIMVMNVYTVETVEQTVAQPQPTVEASNESDDSGNFWSTLIYAPRGLVNKF